MSRFDINTLKKGAHIHFIAIGGISMSGLAEIMMSKGFIVSGSDISETPITQRLETLGAKIFIGQRKENISHPDLCVYSAAIAPDNEEYIAAVNSGAEVIDRATLLGSVMAHFQNSVAVAGTHGKTTTTAMLAEILLASGLDPTVSVGGISPAIGGNIRVGKTDYFVCEACEYHESFLKFFPRVDIILNIEEDHLDYYKNLEHIICAFRSFAQLPGENGAVVAFIDSENVGKAVAELPRERLITCSLTEKADFSADNITYCGNFMKFNVLKKGVLLGPVELNASGVHNVGNALCALAAADFLGADFERSAKALGKFSGVGRRMQIKGERNGITVIDDYAHHPTEISSLLSTVKPCVCGELWCVFQPHTYTRTLTLFDSFVKALSTDMHLVITDIYAAREADTGLVSAKQLADKIPGAVYLDSFEKCTAYLKEHAQHGDTVLTVGAGDVFKVGEAFLQ